MKHKLTNNWGLKLGSLIFAFFLWIIVTNMNDPVIQYRVYNVPVRMTNANIVTDQGKTYEVLDGSDYIDTVTISAARSVIDALNEEDVVAVADFNDLTLQDTITIDLSTKKYNSNLESIKGSITEVKLNIEDLKTKTFALSTVTTGTANDGYMVGEISPAQNQVRVSGPESLINQITAAEVEVAVTGFTQDIVTDAEIELLDSEGNEVPTDSLTMNIESVKVKVEILQTKSVGLEFAAMGVPAEGYVATGKIESNPDSILVAGKPSQLENMTAISVPADVLNLTGQTGDMLTVINIEDYLPSGVSLADASFNGNVTVTVYVEKTVDKRLTLDTSAINWVNIPEGYEVELSEDEETYDVTLSGLRSVVNSLEPADVVATADIKDILEQTDMVGNHYHINLIFSSMKGDIETRSPVQIWFKLIPQ